MYNIDIFNKWNQSITQQFIDQQTINEKIINNDSFHYSLPLLNDLFFISEIKKTLSIKKVFDRLIVYNAIDSELIICTLISTFILLKRLTSKYFICENMKFRIIIGLFIISIKNMDDLHYDNLYWSKLLNISLSDFNLIEITLLNYLDFHTFISYEEFLSIHKMLVD